MKHNQFDFDQVDLDQFDFDQYDLDHFNFDQFDFDQFNLILINSIWFWSSQFDLVGIDYYSGAELDKKYGLKIWLKPFPNWFDPKSKCWKKLAFN